MGFFFFASRAAARFLDEIRHPGVSTAALLLTAASGGGLVAYADSRAENASESSQDAPKKKVVVLGTGWAGTSFLKNVDCSRYEVKVISPRNYFAFTPLLPSVTCGTVEARSIVEPIRRMFEKKNKDVTFYEAECFKIDATKKTVHCRSAVGTNLDGNGDFMVDYDYLVVALGATVNTFNTPGVMEHCYFLKVSRMLLGGMSVIGIYIWASEASFKASSPAVLAQVIRVVSQAVPCYGSGFDERLLIHISYSPRRWACRICEIASGSLRPCDFKYSKLLASLQTFRCTYNFEIRGGTFGVKWSRSLLW